MMSELDKMRGGELADMSDASIQESFRHTKPLLAKFNHLSIYSDNYRETLNDLIPGIPSSSTIMPPFHCDHGHGIHIGNHVFINAFCTFLDGGSITIGDYTLIGQMCRFILLIILWITRSAEIQKNTRCRLLSAMIVG